MKNTVKILSLTMCTALITVMLTGCGGNKNKASGSDVNVEQTHVTEGPATYSDISGDLLHNENSKADTADKR